MIETTGETRAPRTLAACTAIATLAIAIGAAPEAVLCQGRESGSAVVDLAKDPVMRGSLARSTTPKSNVDKALGTDEQVTAGSWVLENPFDRQVRENIARLRGEVVGARATAAEALGFMRAYAAGDALAEAIRDSAVDVRRQAVLSLAWCGNRRHIPILLDALEDSDSVVRQAAWVSLTNLTGMEWPFDGRAPDDRRAKQVAAWRAWWNHVPHAAAPAHVYRLLEDGNRLCRLRAVRALGALGGSADVTRLVSVIEGLSSDYNALDDLDKQIGQSAIRGLGRLGGSKAEKRLIELLADPGWARYAADALGDCGTRRAVAPLIDFYPRYARDLKDRRIDKKSPPFCPPDDRFDGDNTQDRMHETPYAIAAALVRLPLDNPEHLAALRQITPYLLANVPYDWDSGMLYEREAFHEVTAYLLEKSGLRQRAMEIAVEAIAEWGEWRDRGPDRFTGEGASPEECFAALAQRMYGDVPIVGPWLATLWRSGDDPQPLIDMLEHDCGWIRMNAAKALMLMGAREAIEPMASLLKEAPTNAEYGYSGALEHAEYHSPAPRWREAMIRGLGRLHAAQHDALLVTLLEDPRNVVDIHYAAALALDELGTDRALQALAHANRHHPFHSVRLVAREALWRRDLLELADPPDQQPYGPVEPEPLPKDHPAPDALVFIKGDNDIRSDFNGQAGVDPWRQTYTITNSGPVYRRGRNLFLLRPPATDGHVSPLTQFEDGFVADCEVSWDGNRVVFAYRRNGDDRNYREARDRPLERKSADEPLWGGADDPWWHIWEVNIDGTGLRQLTFGPYHDVGPAYLPDGRIVFTTTRLGLRDEYHGYASTGLAVMNPDGTDIHLIGFNLGGDREPAVLPDGRLIFSRLDNFYSRLKTEMTLQTSFPDGTRNVAFYGPERRPFWRQVNREHGAWTLRPAYGGQADNRNRVLRLTQPQPFGDGRVVCASSGGLALVGPDRYEETLIPHDRRMAVTSPFPLGDGRHLICSATRKQFLVNGRLIEAETKEFAALTKGPDLFRSAVNVDLGIYWMDALTGDMQLIYNDPATADFEARPIMARRRPVTLADNPVVRQDGYTARLFCNSARLSREERTRQRGKLIRVVEGQPFVSRHETQTNRPTNRWKNHGGTLARVLGTTPLDADGSFFVEVPADRLLHLQVLDSDRRVVGNQIFWMYARPGETRSCVGCHDHPRLTSSFQGLPPASTHPPLPMLPKGGEFSYRAKAWLKGFLPDEAEERNRTVRAVGLLGRY